MGYGDFQSLTKYHTSTKARLIGAQWREIKTQHAKILRKNPPSMVENRTTLINARNQASESDEITTLTLGR